MFDGNHLRETVFLKGLGMKVLSSRNVVFCFLVGTASLFYSGALFADLSSQQLNSACEQINKKMNNFRTQLPMQLDSVTTISSVIATTLTNPGYCTISYQYDVDTDKFADLMIQGASKDGKHLSLEQAYAFMKTQKFKNFMIKYMKYKYTHASFLKPILDNPHTKKIIISNSYSFGPSKHVEINSIEFKVTPDEYKASGK